jgi:ABC-type phosphate transport system substrate-binding protein
MRTLLTLLAAAAFVAAPYALAQNVDLLGAGATFPAPLVTAMADEYRDVTGGRVTVNYQSIGSGGGIRQFLEQTVMFGMTESYLRRRAARAGPGAERRRGLQPADHPRRRRPVVQPAGRRQGPRVRRRHARRDLPRQHHHAGTTRRSRC